MLTGEGRRAGHLCAIKRIADRAHESDHYTVRLTGSDDIPTICGKSVDHPIVPSQDRKNLMAYALPVSWSSE
jgi:hypothetical protein